jgi:hypothetical protein
LADKVQYTLVRTLADKTCILKGYRSCQQPLSGLFCPPLGYTVANMDCDLDFNGDGVTIESARLESCNAIHSMSKALREKCRNYCALLNTIFPNQLTIQTGMKFESFQWYDIKGMALLSINPFHSNEEPKTNLQNFISERSYFLSLFPTKKTRYADSKRWKIVREIGKELHQPNLIEGSESDSESENNHNQLKKQKKNKKNLECLDDFMFDPSKGDFDVEEKVLYDKIISCYNKNKWHLINTNIVSRDFESDIVTTYIVVSKIDGNFIM